MMTRTALAAVVTAATLTFGSGTAEAATLRHVDRLAVQLEGYSQKLASEFRAHFRHTPEYVHLMSDAERVAELAEHVHDVIHHGRSISHLERDLSKLSRAMHHLQGLVADVERHARHGHGHIHGYLGHVKLLLRSMDSTLRRPSVRWVNIALRVRSASFRGGAARRIRP